MRNRRNTVGIGDEGSTLCARTRDDGCLPRDLDLNRLVKGIAMNDEIEDRAYVKTNERTNDEQDHAKVSGADIESGDHDSAANQGKKDRNDDVITVFESSTRGPGDTHHDNEGNDRRGGLNEVGGSTRESEGGDDLESVLVHDS